MLPKQIYTNALSITFRLELRAACSLKGLPQWLKFTFLSYFSHKDIKVSINILNTQTLKKLLVLLSENYLINDII